MARPKVEPSIKKVKWGIAVTPAQKAWVVDKARELGLSQSGYVSLLISEAMKADEREEKR